MEKNIFIAFFRLYIKLNNVHKSYKCTAFKNMSYIKVLKILCRPINKKQEGIKIKKSYIFVAKIKHSYHVVFSLFY